MRRVHPEHMALRGLAASLGDRDMIRVGISGFYQFHTIPAVLAIIMTLKNNLFGLNKVMFISKFRMINLSFSAIFSSRQISVGYKIKLECNLWKN